MYKILFTAVLIFSFLICFGQAEPMIVKGHIKYGKQKLSKKFHQKLFCFKEGNLVLSERKYFHTFQVDSIISGDFKNALNQNKEVPFELTLGLLNECTFLKEADSLTLTVQNFPATDYYYVDNISQVTPRKKYQEEVDFYHKEHLRRVDILKTGTLQEKKDALDKISTRYNNSNKIDYRYIKYLLPYLNSKDTILDYSLGIACGPNISRTIKSTKKIPFSDYSNLYIRLLLPFEVPEVTNSINWEDWYKKTLSKHTFTVQQYVGSKDVILAECKGISYFLSGSDNEILYFKGGDKYYSLEKTTDKLSILPKEKHEKRRVLWGIDGDIPPSDEISCYAFEKFKIYKRENGIYYQSLELEIDELAEEKAYQGGIIFPNFMLPSNDDFIFFWGDDEDSSNKHYVKIAKMNRTGDWVIAPKNILDYHQTPYPHPEIVAIHGISLSDDSYLIGYSINTYEKSNRSAIQLKKINTKLEVLDSMSLVIDIPHSGGYNYGINRLRLVKNKDKYLLIGVGRTNRDRLYYMILNEQLEPQTEFTQFADNVSYEDFFSTITKDGFIISWIDDSAKEHNIRSILITEDGKKSDIINLINGELKLEGITNHGDKQIDFYIVTDNKLVRKRVALSEYKLN